jgi:hypothetical protein
VRDWFGLRDDSPHGGPPWYYITRDFADAICASGAMAVSLMAALVMWRWWPSAASYQIWMPLIMYSSEVSKGWIIYQACPGLLDGQRSTSRWTTFDSYLHDPDIESVASRFRMAGLLLALTLPWIYTFFGHRFHRRSGQTKREGAGVDG